ncbi:hypothetical protein GGR51DRAFT_176406 [Nemania sp. FL0031]|nr:hypothetical protein GGR51DRAFT_176406 [Nemania sp. FL0031]
MESQHPSIMEMPDEVILCIVEQMDTITRKCFMATNKGTSALIESYEHSIAKRRAASFTIPPLRNILSSSTEERFVLSTDTFSGIIELELRESRIDRLLQECPQFFCLPSPPWLPSLTPKYQARVEIIFKRALQQCDRIADIAANEPSVRIPVEYYHAILDEVYRFPTALTSPHDDLYKFNPLTRPDARLRQIEYIQSLPLDDIAGIFLLVESIGYGLMYNTNKSLGVSSRYERKTVIEECVLRHGTWFAWSRILGGPDLQELASCIISAGRAEAAHWESGDIDGLHGLKMTLISQFAKLVGSDIIEGKSNVNMENAILQIVFQGDKVLTGWEDNSDDKY